MEAKRTLPLQDAVSRIFDGSSILLFPGHESAALAFEIVRQGRKDLTIITSSYCFSVDLLVRSSAVKRILSGGHDLWDYPNESPATIVEVPAALLRSQLSAALSGISCAASQVPPQAFKVFPELYCRTGDICLAHAIVPDFAILHAARADFAGNVQLDPIENGLMSGDLLYARAAKQSLVSVEQIVTKEAIVINEKQTVLHAAQDPLLIEAPYGAYPCGYVSRYSADNAWLAQYRQAQTDTGLLQAALPIFPMCGSWYDYLQQLGFHRLMALTTNRRGE
ncbi:MAG: hypothetical protein ACLS3F_10055 [Oscillospiraceae bacterium]